jgi:hypothetical protein
MTDQMIERAVAALGHDDDCAGNCHPDLPRCHVWLRMTVALDALMPEVDSVEAWDALPPGTWLIGSGGSLWWNNSTNHHPAHILAEYGPLRVIWTPEATK